MKRKCLLARAFSRGRQWHTVRLSAARAAQPPILAAWHHVTIIPRSENACLQGHFREAVNAESVPQARLGAKPPEAAKQHPTKAIIPRSENACLQGHFREAVNAESVPQARLGAKPPEAAKQHPTKAIIPRSENACMQGHFREAVNCAAAHCAEAAKPLDFAF